MKKVDDVELAFAEWNEAIEILKLLVSVIQQKRQPKIITPLLRVQFHLLSVQKLFRCPNSTTQHIIWFTECAALLGSLL